MLHCEGTCGDSYHCNCVGISDAEYKLISDRKGFLFLCDTCRVRCEVDLKDRWTSLFDTKFDKLKNELQSSFDLKFEILVEDKLEKLSKLLSDKCDDVAGRGAEMFDSSALASELRLLRGENEVLRGQVERLSALLEGKSAGVVDGGVGAPLPAGLATPQSYAGAAKNRAKVVIRSKTANVSASAIKADILNKINPVTNEISISEVRDLGNSGILVNCSDTADRTKFLKLADEKLTADYNVRGLKSIQPKVRIVGITQMLEEKEFVHYLRAQNRSLFPDDSACSFIKLSPVKSNNKTFQATISVDAGTYRRLISSKRVMIGFDSCMVYDAISVLRCFKCNSFHHISANCSNSISCPVCAGPHDLKDCKSSVRQCCNCISLKNKKNLNIKTDHAAFDYGSCHAYGLVVDRLRDELIGPAPG